LGPLSRAHGAAGSTPGNLSALHPDVDPERATAERLAGRYGAAVVSQAEALADPSVNAVVIASSTDTSA
jgi:myo-inositol 2-dehydrogenase / D-chiro-inositol 1-dehydrogenase